MTKKLYILFLLAIFTSCQPSTKNKETKTTSDHLKIVDHSFSNIQSIHTTHLDLTLNVDFDRKVLTGIARHTMKNNGADKAVFDINNLKIEKVTTGQKGSEIATTFTIGKGDSIHGQPLIVDITSTDSIVNIYYTTSPQAVALDWLTPQLAGDSVYPFLYTQGESILNRSWIPLQDTPENRITYSANVTVPEGMIALMSATNPTTQNDTNTYHFEMNKPIPSYLIAMAVGNLKFHSLGEDCGVYALPKMIDSAAYEFVDLPKMIHAVESMYGEYKWGRYDVLVLPNSFPFGGMENPELTFLTPTIITGDRSLVDVVAHELSHSWSGNLVTNATWEDFWLNEGFTDYIELRIMEKLYGKAIADIYASIEYQTLVKSIKHLTDEGRSKDTRLKINLKDRNPDDGMTYIPYTKGCYFLRTLEAKVGREKFDIFLNSYFKDHQFQSITTDEFIAYLKKNLLEKYNVDFNYKEWIFGEGIPKNIVRVHSTRIDEMKALAQSITEGKTLPHDLKRKDKITQEWLTFINAFDGKLSKEQMKAIDAQLHFTASKNAEIMCAWFVLGIKNDYTAIRPNMKAFLVTVGREKFLEDIYFALAHHSKETLAWAKEVYKIARPHYQYVSYSIMDEILGYTPKDK